MWGVAMSKPSLAPQPSLFSAYREAGLCVIPLKDGAPLVKWGQYIDTLPLESEVIKWRGDEFALICGKVSGVIALDLDTDNPETIARIEAIAGVSPVKKIGSKGFSAFYRYNGEKTARWGTEVEILSDKHLTTIPPSKHRAKAGVVYKWMGRELLGADLPMLPATFYAVMDALYPKPPQRDTVHYMPRDYDSLELTQAEEMLSYLDPSCNRDEWVAIGMALKSEYGDTACGLWHDWSSKSATKYKQKDAQTAWRSFNGYGIGIGTLVHKAKQAGYQFAHKPIERAVPAAKPEIPKEKPFNPHVDGLVGEIADWITATAYAPQPVLSLSAALVFMGMVKAHRVKGATKLRTNLYCLSLAPTAGGKEHPEACITELMRACGLGRHKLGKPKSGSAILTGLNKADCRGLLSLSEIGHYAANFMDKRAGSFQKEIGHLIIELFNKAGGTYEGDQYANEKENKQAVFFQPSLSILGSSVPERLQMAVTGAEVIDGFLNRWIAFQVTTRPPIPDAMEDAPPPQALVDKIKKWMDDNPTNVDNYGEPHPRLMVFTREAYDDLMKYKRDMREKLDIIPYPINQLYGRAAEHAEKIAMVITDGNDIGTPELTKAIEIVNQSNRVITEFCRGISDSPHDQMVHKVLEAIKNAQGGWIKRRDLTRATRWLEPRKRFEILAQLQESEEIEKLDDGKITKYRFIQI